ncbi:MAG TPA: radical SAM protein [Methyloceanibacter sp.]|nr:radical SAM protein [Methyloceanibacter sp.]
MLKNARGKRFQLILIKPSHYDADGYVVQWLRSTMPSNSLAAVYSLARGAADRQVLGPDLPIDVIAMDETNTRVRPREIAKRIARNGGLGLVGLIGVQSNEFPRALDIARPLRAAGVQVMIGGFHVSGCLAMLKDTQTDIKVAQALGISIFAGEAEEGLDEVLQDAARGELRDLYNHMKVLPGIGDVPSPPFLPVDFVKRTVGNVTSFDAGRGCPFQCSFCTIINVQGRKSRYRSPDSIEQILRMNWAQGVKRFFITDDNFARNKDWEAIYDRIIKLREEDGMDVRFMIQVDTLCHKIPNFIEKSRRAGVTRVFIGLENINPANLIAAKKRQNKITEYRKMLLEWKRVGIMTFAGYILGFPNDTSETIRHDLEIIKKELPLDALEFFVLTPLPGSEDHKVLYEKNVWMDPDLNKYELEHVVTGHARMTKQEWQGAYRSAWDIFYTDEHLETIMRRAHATGINIRSLMPVLMWFSSAVKIEELHPLQWGIFRVKYRKDRRPGLPIESPLSFYASYASETARKAVKLARRWRHLKSIVAKIEADPHAKSYQDEALIPVGEEDAEHMELYTQSETVRAAVKHERRVAGGPASGHQPKVHAGNGHAGNGHNGNGLEENGLGDAAHHDAGHHDHAHEHRPDIAPPAA